MPRESREERIAYLTEEIEYGNVSAMVELGGGFTSTGTTKSLHTGIEGRPSKEMHGGNISLAYAIVRGEA